jgi:hypothetical protein
MLMSLGRPRHGKAPLHDPDAMRHMDDRAQQAG